ncbi:hypothetical protein DMN91_000013 [Ooceraea biroi]|uniref:C2H2-type domain-containing protein n=1 Tax=Ooceraea biroi TaxID=2015173 RepID=A0A3L8E0I1_OOCBI|nr:zinc finger protein Dzip1 [Ooceraea biroi]RLU26220.1 hypothetical protein DMN91_000013 [Ooceraea biroi]
MAFSFRAGTNWCHDFPKLARESGFYFNMHGSRVRVDWNRISVLDIDRVVRERDFSTIDENINNVIDYCLEGEYDVKILDPSFVKLFRLAQLSVEYLLYCKQYLDHSVVILKDELRQKIEQNVSMKKEITTLEDTIKNLKERSKEKRKLIETSIGEIPSGEIYKCPHCPKTFVRAIFVNAHIARKHPYVSDMSVSTSPVHEHYRVETEKLHNEIKTLKERLNQTERVIRNESVKLLDNEENKYVSRNENDISKLERLQEQRRYQEDIGSLKNMLFNEIHALREKNHTMNDSILEANIKTLISQQEKEIENLRSQLLERLTPGIENMQVKLQTQENYWKAKIGDMETQHRQDIERLTTELRGTQQVADRIKSEYASKVEDLERLSMDQSSMLVEQRKQLNSLSREINNSQTQISLRNHREKDTVERVGFHESPLVKLKRSSVSSYNDGEGRYRSSYSAGNGEMVIEDVGSGSSQEYSDKLTSIVAESNYASGKKDDVNSKRDSKKFITDLVQINPRNSGKPDARKTKDRAKHNDTFRDVNETNDRASKICTTKENIDSMSKKRVDISGNVERRGTLHSDDMKSNRKLGFLERRSVSSATESELSSSSMTQSESDDSESVTVTDDVTVKKYETPVIKCSNIRRSSIQEDARNAFNNRLRDLGIDPEWQGIPAATFKQKMEIVRHQQNINAKKLNRYNQIKQKILEDVLQRISTKDSGLVAKKSPLDKLVTRVKSKALKAFGSHKDNDEHMPAQKTENMTPSKLRLKQKIELLPKKYKDSDTFESTRESPLKRNGMDIHSPKVVPHPRSISDRYRNRDTSSVSSIESREDVKQITKVTVSDASARKAGSPISRKQVVATKFSEHNESDDAVVQQEDSIVSLKNNKSVLKSVSGSVGSLVKKKVLFDLEDGEEDDATALGSDHKKIQRNNSDWNISSSPERREYALQKEKSMSTGNIILKTSQSDKIAEISKKIQEQLSIARKPPIGSVETIFRSHTNLHDLTNYNTGSHLFSSTSVTSPVSENPARNFTSPTAKINVFPQPAPRTLKDKDLRKTHSASELRYSDLDSDIDEILQME